MNGRPVVTFHAGGVQGILIEVNGWLVPLYICSQWQQITAFHSNTLSTDQSTREHPCMLAQRMAGRNVMRIQTFS